MLNENSRAVGSGVEEKGDNNRGGDRYAGTNGFQDDDEEDD